MVSSDKLRILVNYIGENELKIRLSGYEDWFGWISLPVEGYLDVGVEPIKISEIKYIDIDCIKEIYIGIRVPPKRENVLNEVEEILKESDLKYETISNNILRVFT